MGGSHVVHVHKHSRNQQLEIEEEAHRRQGAHVKVAIEVHDQRRDHLQPLNQARTFCETLVVKASHEVDTGVGLLDDILLQLTRQRWPAVDAHRVGRIDATGIPPWVVLSASWLQMDVLIRKPRKAVKPPQRATVYPRAVRQAYPLA
eukprot:2580022-Prymnesium_polylepis.2